MLNSDLDNSRLEIPVSETPPGPLGIKMEPKEDCKDSLSAFMVELGVEPPPIKIENYDSSENNDEYGSLSEDYTVDVKKLKTEHSEDSKEWLNNYRIKSEENDQLTVSGEDQDDFTEDSNIKSEEMHIKEDDGINEPGMSSISCLPNNEDNTEDECTPTTKTEFHCHKCQYKTIAEPNLKRHLLLEHKTLKCNECSFETDCKRTLDDHLIEHMASKGATFSCYQCNFETITAARLKAHLRHYCNKGEIYRCDKCEYGTVFSFLLKEHSRIHDDKKITKHLLCHSEPEEFALYECSHCPYQTCRKYDLNNHLLKHTK